MYVILLYTHVAEERRNPEVRLHRGVQIRSVVL